MGSEILVVSSIGILIGALIAYLITRKVDLRKFTKEYKDLQKITNDPELILEKLNSNGRMEDMDEVLKYSILEEDGVKKLKVERTPLKVPKKVPVKSPEDSKKPKKKSKAKKKNGSKSRSS